MALEIADRKFELRHKIALLGCLAEPRRGLHVVLGNTLTHTKDDPKVVLRIDIPLLGCLPIPTQPLRRILRDTLALCNNVPESVLRFGMPLLGRLPKPTQPLRRILRDNLALEIAFPEVVLRFRIPHVFPSAGTAPQPRTPEQHQADQQGSQQFLSHGSNSPLTTRMTTELRVGDPAVLLRKCWPRLAQCDGPSG